jgi:hypothetical protein
MTRLQGINCERMRARIKIFLSWFQRTANEREMLRAFANADMAGAGAFEPPNGGIKIRPLARYFNGLIAQQLSNRLRDHW